MEERQSCAQEVAGRNVSGLLNASSFYGRLACLVPVLFQFSH